MDIRQRKEKLRQHFLKQRREIPEEVYRSASEEIIQKLLKLREFKEADYVHSYVSLNDRGEVDTHRFIKDVIASGKKVIVPVTNFQKGTLTHVLLNSYSDLEANKWGVPEPDGGKEISPEKIDLVIVPMVAADESCNRIGYGKGFYDRFLKEVECPKLGLIFERNVVDELPSEDFDIPLDKIVTERRIIERD